VESQESDSDDLDVEAINSDDLSDDDKEFEVPEESKISKTLSDKTTRTVIILVLILLFLLALCNADTYNETDFIHRVGVVHLKSIYDLGPESYPQYKKAYAQYLLDTTGPDKSYPLIFVHIANPDLSEYPTYQNNEELWDHEIPVI